MSEEIKAEVLEIIAEQLETNLDDLKPEAGFVDDLGADSLAVVELVLALEQKFEIEIPDEDTEKIRTVNDAVTYIVDHAGS